MAIRDTEAFLRERYALFDPSADVNVGSPLDVQVIQPLVRRLGQDPFTVDITTFINDRMAQAFPELATKEGDAITDLLNKPASILWDPFVRENRRIQRSLSFRDPSTLTLDEADALGANLFNERRKGNISRGAGRVLFNAPQNVSISPANFFTSKGGLHFFPSEIQSIRTEEMLLNVTSENLYYFDVNCIAEGPGSQFNIGPNELVSIANVPAAVRVANVRRFGFGENEETAVQFVDRVRQSLSERSLVTLRGIAAKILDNFPDVNRLNVVGFNDPEMQRDVIRGGGLGGVIASGIAGIALADGENKANTRRFFTSEANFLSDVLGDATDFVLTLFGATSAVEPAVDLSISSVVGANEVNLVDQLLILGTTAIRWALRKRELTLSGIPGGILFPDSANGTVDVPNDEVHIGGAYDVHLRGTDFDEATLAIDNVTDDEPLFAGSDLNITAGAAIELGDFVLDTDYVSDDETFNTFADAELFTYALQILEGPDAGNYRILGVTQTSGLPVTLTTDPVPGSPSTGPFRWRLFDQINIDLVEPKETRLDDSDLRTVQGSAIVDTVGGTNFDDFGVAEDDIIRILSGPDAGDFVLVADPIAPSFDKLQLDTELTQSQSNLDYIIFRPNAGGGILRPLVRLTEIELLDSSNQPIGSTIPYAKPVDVQSRAFQNPARGIKHDIRDATLGIVSLPFGGWAALGTGTLLLLIAGVVRTVTFTSPATLAAAIADINVDILASAGIPDIAVQVGADRFGIRPVRGGVVVVGGTTHGTIFGVGVSASPFPVSTFDIRSADIVADGGFGSLDPLVDLLNRLDVVQVLDGDNVGFYDAPYVINNNVSVTFPFVSDSSPGLTLSATNNQTTLPSGFAPAITKRVQIGARSLGSARVYFLEATSFEVDPNSRFSLDTEAGVLEFLPDPTLRYQRVPPLPGGTVPTDGSTADAGSILTSASQDFVLSAIQAGDEVVIENHPLAGTVSLTNPVVNLVNRTLIYSLDGGPDRTLTFIRDDVSLATDEVSRQGVVNQINASAGEAIAQLTAGNELEFETTRDLVVRDTGTANILVDLVAATGILTLTAAPLDTETVVIDAKTYTFQTVLTNVDGNVQIGATAALSLNNLIDAINLGPGAGVDYAAATTLHPTVSALAGVGDTMDATANSLGVGGNSIATTTTVTGGSWGSATLTGGETFEGLLEDVAGTGGALNFGTADQNNESPHAGDYTVSTGGVAVGALTVDEAFPSSAPFTSPITRQTYRVLRAGLQRITTTAMADNEAEASLLFFDVELISEGTGDEYNIDADQQMLVTGFRSDGYFLTTSNEDLAFSASEPVSLVLSRTILEQGVDDDPSNATQVSSQNIQVTYERTPLVEDVQNYLSSDVERVVCSSPLSRHLIPVFVRFDMVYVGGSRESVVVPEVETYIRDLFPIDALESSDIQKIALDRGATSIDNPLDLIGIVHRVDRTVYAVRSQNFITSGRLSAFIPDVLDITRNTT